MKLSSKTASGLSHSGCAAGFVLQRPGTLLNRRTNRSPLLSRQSPTPHVSRGLTSSGPAVQAAAVAATVAAPSVSLQATQHRTSRARPIANQLCQEDQVKVFVSLGKDVAPCHKPLSLGEGLKTGLKAVKRLGVDGIVLELLWGAVENATPGEYDWQHYRNVVHVAQELGLRVKVVLSMYGTEECPLPEWVRKVGEDVPDIFYTDRSGTRNKECISLGTDHVPVLQGRTGIQVLSDFLTSFKQEFHSFLGSTITDCVLGVGPQGELKYPAQPCDQRWNFPGVGEYQCYDRFMLATLKASTQQLSQPSWGNAGPHDAGNYCLWPHQTGFFQHNGNWNTTYGRFFLQWYSDMLARHAHDIAAAASHVMDGTGVQLFVKIPGIHWWYNTAAHAPELTAGYYNTSTRDGYLPVFKLLQKHGVGVQLGMAEMKNTEQMQQAFCDPEKLLLQQRTTACALQLPIVLENSAVRFDDAALSRLESHLFDYTMNLGLELPPVKTLVFNSVTEAMFQPDNWQRFKSFMNRLEERALKAALQSQNERCQAALAEKEEASRGPPTGRPVFA